ncbi:MAG TPA: flagellar biosynthesis anti-sigma factor FlgM [Clostridiales bacterium]|nr:flagellar biosynthesis anti-sigma factor FlgM [Clostridiales bacterium]
MKALKINGSRFNNIVNPYKLNEQYAQKAKKKVTSSERDEVILSEEAQRLQSTKVDKHTIEKIKNDRAKRVDEVKALIEEGQYQVDAELVADKMLDNVLYDKKV